MNDKTRPVTYSMTDRSTKMLDEVRVMRHQFGLSDKMLSRSETIRHLIWQENMKLKDKFFTGAQVAARDSVIIDGVSSERLTQLANEAMRMAYVAAKERFSLGLASLASEVGEDPEI